MGVGHMAMSYTHTRLVYTAKSADDQYIDLTIGLALMNGKNCSQFSSKDKPHLVTGTVRLESAGESISAAKNTWIVRNACVKAAAAWRRTLRSAGIRRKKQLNTYARNPRFAISHRHSQTWGILGSQGANIIPDGVDTNYSTGVYTSDGEEIKVWAYADPSAVDFSLPQNVYAFTQTTFAVPTSTTAGETDVLDKKVNLLGDVDATTYTNVVAEYIDSRINDAEIEDTDLEASPSTDNDFVMMLAPGEEVADDVLDNVDDEGKWRPYTLNTSTHDAEIVTPDCNVAGQDTHFEAPLGLLRWSPGSNGNQLVIDVYSISEM